MNKIDTKELELSEKVLVFINTHITDLNEMDKLREAKLKQIQSLIQCICILNDLEEGQWNLKGNKLIKIEEEKIEVK